MSLTDNPIFSDPQKAREWLEALLWPMGPVCPHCGLVGAAYAIEAKRRDGLYKCKGCSEQFTVTVGTVMERSHIPLHKWLLALHLMAASKKGISAHQMHRMLGVSYKSAWFMMHRLREAMREAKFTGPLGGANKVVEVDETYVGGKAANRRDYIPPKEPVVALGVDDESRAKKLAKGVVGKRLTYRRTNEQPAKA